MRLFFTAMIIAGSFFISGYKTQSAGLGETFIQSLKENKFELLKNFFPTIEFYKSLPEASKKTDAEIKSLLKSSNDRLKKSWQTIIDGLKDRKVDVADLMVKETLIFDPFPAKNEMKGMVIVYSYKDKNWDDLSFIISQWKGKTFLLEIPNPTKAFTFYDAMLKSSSRAKASVEMAKPEFKKSMNEKVKTIIELVKNNNLQGFAENLVYRGEDQSRKWKSQLNYNDSTEKQQAIEFMNKVNRSIRDCDEYKTNELKTESESEGTWIVLPIQCGKKTVSFAFLRIGDRILLGDIESETN